MAARNLTNPIVSRAFANALLAMMVPAETDSPALVSPKLALLGTSELVITPDTTLAELAAQQTEFTGYTATGQALDVEAPGVVRLGTNVQGLCGNAIWVLAAGAPTVTGTITGAYLADTTFGLICSAYFDEPVTLANVGDYLDVFWGVPMVLQLS